MPELNHGHERLLLQANLITNEVVKAFTIHCLRLLPGHFWTQPSSSSGKRHPPDERGFGGLALHTYRVSVIAEILMKASMSLFTNDKDSIRVACLFHDAGRYGFLTKPSEHSLDYHPTLSASFLETGLKNYSCLTPEAQDMLEASIEPIRCHMGQWGKWAPKTSEDWIVHYADMVATNYYGV